MKIPRELLYKFSQGHCTPEEKKLIDDWVDNGEWDINEESISSDIKKSIWQKLNDEIAFPSKVVKFTRRYNLLKIAAVFAIVFTSLALIYFLQKDDLPVDYVFETKTNEQKRILLSDSSVIFMSSNSIVKVKQPFPKNKRDIDLIGEASFEVAKDSSRPFTVITNNIRTTALGTSFKVTSFPGNDNISVELSYGKVLVQNLRSKDKTDSIYLASGEAIEYSKINKKIDKMVVPAQKLNYKSNILYFKEAGIKEVVKKLEKFYNIKVEYELLSEVDWRISGEFDYQPLEIVMENIAFSCNISYKKVGDTLILIPQKTHSEP